MGKNKKLEQWNLNLCTISTSIFTKITHFFSARISPYLLHKFVLVQTLSDLRKTNRGFLNRDLTVLKDFFLLKSN